MFDSPESVTREILGQVPTTMVRLFYLLTALACCWAAIAVARRVASWRRGRPSADARRWHWLTVLSYLAFHEQIRRDRYAGVAHLCTFYGFVVLFIGTCIVFLEHQTPLHFFYGAFYLAASCIIELGGLVFVIGLLMFLRRRAGDRTPRLLRAWWVPLMSWLLLAIAISGFLLEAARIAEAMPGFERWSFVGYGLAAGLRAFGVAGDSAVALHRLLWSGHAVLCVVFFAALPVFFFAHMIYGAASWALRRPTPLATLRTPPATSAPGVRAVTDYPWHDLMQADACTTCGRCNDACPAHAAGKQLQPRNVVLAIRGLLDAGNRAPTALAAAIPDAATWACTTCGACNHACPVGIDVYDKIIEVRRGCVESGRIPEAAEQVLDRTVSEANPFAHAAADRLAWAMDLRPPIAAPEEPVELLYWVGCAGSFDPDGQRVSRAMIRILTAIGTNYRILGKRECCTGDPARRLGEEGLFRDQAEANIALLQQHAPKRILTHCAHCFNTFRNEYPALGGNFEVEHHSQFLNRLVAERNLRLASGDGTMTYHDPCYLARGNGEVTAPRELIRQLTGKEVNEMPRHGCQSFCCGAGGGAMWLDVPGKVRVENLRAEEAAATGARTVVTACPFCKTMLAAGLQASEDTAGIATRDLAELVAEALEQEMSR